MPGVIFYILYEAERLYILYILCNLYAIIFEVGKCVRLVFLSVLYAWIRKKEGKIGGMKSEIFEL